MGKILKNGISYAGGGSDGKSAYQTWLDLGNTGTEQDFLDSLGGGENSLYVVTGSLDMENEENPVILNQTFEEVKAAYNEGKTIIADILVAGEAQYQFNLLYVLEDAIAFEWINSAAKVGGQINLMNDNTVSFAMTSLEGSDAPSTLVVTGNYSVDADDNWIVSNINKTFEKINEAISNNQDVVLKIYPEGDTSNPYILYPAMHYVNMGTAFSLIVPDTEQISGISVMITADNQVMATRSIYDFEELKKSVSDGKTLVAGAITDNGVETAADAEFAVMAENIGKLPIAPNGSVWTLSDYVPTGSSPSIKYGGGVWIALGNKKLHYSTNGAHWETVLDCNVDGVSYISHMYCEELKIWVAYESPLSSGTAINIYYSEDGITWTKSLSNVVISTVAYHDGVLLAFHGTYNYSQGIWMSEDGKNWTDITSQLISGAGWTLHYLEGRWYMSGSNYNGKALYYSNDGKTWSKPSGLLQLNNLKKVNGRYFCMGSPSASSATLRYSDDGITWNSASVTWKGSTTYGTVPNYMVFFKGVYVMSTYSGIAYSTDGGKAWTQATTELSKAYMLYKFKNTLLAIGTGGPSSGSGIYYSTDGINWTKVDGITSSISNNSIYECNGKLYVTLGSSPYRLFCSEDGKAWNEIPNQICMAGVYNGIYFSSYGHYSIDCENWIPSNIYNNNTAYLYFAFADGMMLLAHANGIYYSKANPFIE